MLLKLEQAAFVQSRFGGINRVLRAGRRMMPREDIENAVLAVEREGRTSRSALLSRVQIRGGEWVHARSSNARDARPYKTSRNLREPKAMIEPDRRRLPVIRQRFFLTLTPRLRYIGRPMPRRILQYLPDNSIIWPRQSLRRPWRRGPYASPSA